MLPLQLRRSGDELADFGPAYMTSPAPSPSCSLFKQAFEAIEFVFQCLAARLLHHPAEQEEEALDNLGDADWHIDGTDMLVRAVDFDMCELLDWVRIWLVETGFECSELVPAPVGQFDGTNDHASLVAALKSKMDRDGES